MSKFIWLVVKYKFKFIYFRFNLLIIFQNKFAKGQSLIYSALNILTNDYTKICLKFRVSDPQPKPPSSVRCLALILITTK